MRPAMVGNAPRDRREQCASGTSEADQTNESVTVTERFRAEVIGDRGPKERKGREAESSDEGGTSQFGELTEQADDGAKQGRIRDRLTDFDDRKFSAKQYRENRHGDRGEDEHRAPVEKTRHRTGDRSGQENAEEKAGHDRADDT